MFHFGRWKGGFQGSDVLLLVGRPVQDNGGEMSLRLGQETRKYTGFI